MRDVGLNINWPNCELFRSELVFDGHKLPNKGKELFGSRKLLCMLYTRHGQLSRYTKLTRKNRPFVFGDEQRKSFETLKKHLSEARTLGYFDVRAKSKVMADASLFGLGAILIQVQNWGPRVIAHASRSLSEVER